MRCPGYRIARPAGACYATLGSAGSPRYPAVDLLSLDVEGYELSVLQGLDFERHAPSWLLIEARFRKEIDDYLAPRYEVAEELSHHDILYRRR
ncbi:MAG: FkbM family methyltransferase [Rubripirellula sp.]|nr:FkbM family methyltransferase [Rubripirellula sp.]